MKARGNLPLVRQICENMSKNCACCHKNAKLGATRKHPCVTFGSHFKVAITGIVISFNNFGIIQPISIKMVSRPRFSRSKITIKAF